MYSFPNIVLPLLGGVLIDVFGVRRFIVVFCTLTFLGQIVASIGVLHRSIAVVLLGRTIFGLGGESLSVGQTVMSNRWFADSHLSLALGLNLATARLGTVTNNYLNPVLARSFGVVAAVFSGVVTCGGSWLAAFGLVVLDSRNFPHAVAVGDRISLREIRELSGKFWLLLAIIVCIYGVIVPFNIIANKLLMAGWYPGDTVYGNKNK